MVTFLLLIVFFENVFSQSVLVNNKNQTTDLAIIRWVYQYPEANDSYSPGAVARFSQLLFGKPLPTLDKPFAVIGKNSRIAWIADQGYNSVFYLNHEKNKVSKFHIAQFSSLVGICFSENNNIYFTDSRLNKIFLITNNSKKPEILNDSLSLLQPTGISYSFVNREIWIVETGAHQITVLDEKGKFKKSIGKRGNNPGEFNYPTSIWIENSGDVFVVDAMNFRIQIFDKNGIFKSMFGKAGNGTGYLARPKGIATDSFGNIYIVDALFNTIQIFDKNGNFLYNFGKYGTGQGEFSMPAGLYIDENNFIYVADSFNARIQVFQLINGNQYNENTH